MSEYQRFVSYIYKYHGNKKSKNCGFSRVEVRDHKCHLEVHMKLPVYPFTPVFHVYAFVSTDGQLMGLSLGNASYHQGAVYGAFAIPDSNINNLPYGINDLGGLYIQTDEGEIFATAWKEISIQPNLFFIYKDTPQIHAASTELPVSDFSGAHTDTAETPTLSEKTDEPDTAPDDDTDALPSSSVDPWKKIQDTYPHTQPFFDDSIHQCVQLSLEDIPNLCQHGFPIGVNQFLIHGCQSFHHFLLGKPDSTTDGKYILAVPGIYDEKEQFLASLFGFPNFKPAKSTIIRSGQFGYWYRLLY